MQNNLLDKYIKLSRIIITFFVFIVLNGWFLYENDPQWIFSIIISVVVLVISSPSSKICKFLINKGDKIESKILKILHFCFTNCFHIASFYSRDILWFCCYIVWEYRFIKFRNWCFDCVYRNWNFYLCFSSIFSNTDYIDS